MTMMYLAGPFFNPIQESIIDNLASICRKYGVPYFSPKDHAKLLSDGDHAATFADDVRGLERATHVLAVLDFAMLPSQSLLVVDSGTGNPHRVVAKPNLPDTGTVWEMGYAFARNIPVIAFTRSLDGDGTINLMLLNGCRGVVRGWVDAEAFLAGERGDFDWSVVRRIAPRKVV